MKKLLTEADLTLTELSVGMKAAEKNGESLKGKQNSIKSVAAVNGMSQMWTNIT